MYVQKLFSSYKTEVDRYIFVQNLLEQISCSSKCIIYKHVIEHFSLQYYLCKPIPYVYKKHISRIRLSSHNLEIETGRHKNTPRENRVCKFCKHDLEDEYHFVLICPQYEELRHKHIKKYYWQKPSVFKFIQLLSIRNVHQLCNLGKYLHFALKVRENLVN